MSNNNLGYFSGGNDDTYDIYKFKFISIGNDLFNIQNKNGLFMSVIPGNYKIGFEDTINNDMSVFNFKLENLPNGTVGITTFGSDELGVTSGGYLYSENNGTAKVQEQVGSAVPLTLKNAAQHGNKTC